MSRIFFEKHAPIDAFDIQDDRLCVGGQPIDRLADYVGRTPFYAYDRSLLDHRVEQLRTHLPSELLLHYAIKANPMPAVVHHMRGLVDGFDVASSAEMRVAIDAGMSRKHISFAGPGKTDHELTSAAAAGITVNLESENEMERLAVIASKQRQRTPVAIRVNPDFQLKSSGMKMGGGAQQFGVDADRVPAMLDRLGELPLQFIGFHIYAGSQNLKADALEQAQASTLELAVRLAAGAPSPMRLLNMGGGLGIPYFPGEQPLDLATVGANLSRLLVDARPGLGDSAVVMELGRYLVGEAGIYVCRVVDVKESRGQVFLVTDGGLHHHLAASGNFGQVIRKNYPVIVGTRVSDGQRQHASVVGPLCTPLDLLADRMEMGEARVGDLVVVFQSGAYGPTASPSRFLSHPPCEEILV